mgnify:FL=1
MISILGLVAFSLFVFAIIAFKRQIAIRNRVKDLSLKYDFKYKELKKEFNLTLKSSLGGPGI